MVFNTKVNAFFSLDSLKNKTYIYQVQCFKLNNFLTLNKWQFFKIDDLVVNTVHLSLHPHNLTSFPFSFLQVFSVSIFWVFLQLQELQVYTRKPCPMVASVVGVDLESCFHLNVHNQPTVQLQVRSWQIATVQQPLLFQRKSPKAVSLRFRSLTNTGVQRILWTNFKMKSTIRQVSLQVKCLCQ